MRLLRETAFRTRFTAPRLFSAPGLFALALLLSFCFPQTSHADTVDASKDMAPGISLGNALVPFASGEALFIDARSEDAYEQGHIQSSVSMPAEDFVDLPTSRLEKLEGFADLIVYCDGANATLSTSLARHLTAAGLPARVLQGGFSVWVKNGLPVEPANLGADFGHNKNHCPSCDY